jgi:hypothetical protein
VVVLWYVSVGTSQKTWRNVDARDVGVCIECIRRSGFSDSHRTTVRVTSGYLGTPLELGACVDTLREVDRMAICSLAAPAQKDDG